MYLLSNQTTPKIMNNVTAVINVSTMIIAVNNNASEMVLHDI